VDDAGAGLAAGAGVLALVSLFVPPSAAGVSLVPPVAVEVLPFVSPLLLAGLDEE
jgi:hypothetical protein